MNLFNANPLYETKYGVNPTMHTQHPWDSQERRGLTRFEWCVCIVILLLLAFLFLPGVRTAREAARRMQCSNNLKQISLAMHNYHDAHKRFPPGWGGPAQLVDRDHQSVYIAHEASDIGLPPVGRLSAFIAILPYVEQPFAYDWIQDGYREGAVELLPPIAPWNDVNETFRPWNLNLSCYRCPSDGYQASRYITPTNYALCYGDRFLATDETNTFLQSRGVFHGRTGRKIGDIKKGTSYTILASETLITGKSPKEERPYYSSLRNVIANLKIEEASPRSCREKAPDKIIAKKWQDDARAWRGSRWGDGAPSITGFTTNIPPNSASCSLYGEEGVGFYGVSSHHHGGVSIANVDGSVRFVTDGIDCGDQTQFAITEDADSPSPYGTWGALGSIYEVDADPATE